MTDDPTQQLADAVSRRAEGTGYVVARTAEGFRVERDLSDATWWGPLFKAGVHTLTAHDVRVDPTERRLTITDQMRGIEWKGDALPQPRWSGKAEVTRGRVMQVGFQKSYGLRGDGKPGTIEDYRYDTSEGRDLVRGAAKELGWHESMPWEQKVAIALAVVGGVGALVTVLVLLGALALGKF